MTTYPTLECSQTAVHETFVNTQQCRSGKADDVISSKWRIMKHLARLYDLFIFIAAFIFVTFALDLSSHGMDLAGFTAVRIKLGNCLLFALLLLVWHNILIICGLYVSKRLTSRPAETLDVCKATLLACMFLFLAAKASKDNVKAAEDAKSAKKIVKQANQS